MAEKQISKLSALLLLNTRAFEQSLSDAEKTTKRTAAAMKRTGQQLSLGLSVPLALVGRQVVDTATSFEYQMARVQAISGATAQSFNRLQKNAEELGASTIFQATSVAQLQEEYAKLGFVASEITAVTESTLSLAQVTGSDLGRAAEIAGSTLRTFNKDVSEVGQVNDVIAVAISQSALDFESFAETMKYAGSQAAISNVSMEEISAAMGVLANRGVKGSIAGTRLRMILAKLAEEGGNTHDKFIELINGTMTMTEAIERFGVRAASAVPVLQENREEFFALETSMIQAAGTLDVMQKTMDDTAFSVQRRFISALEDLAIQFGKVLLPAVNFITEGLIALTNAFAALPGPIKTIIVAAGAFVTAYGPFLFVLGHTKDLLLDMGKLFPKVGAAMVGMLGPTGAIVAGITALVGIFVGLTLQGEKVRDLQGRISDANAAAAESAGKVLSPIRALIGEYENENTSMQRKMEILRELERSQPDYFNNLSKEETQVSDLRNAYDKLSESIKRSAKARAIESQLTQITGEQGELIGRQVQAQLRIEEVERLKAEGDPSMQPRISERMGTTYDPAAAAIASANREIEEAQRQLDDLDRMYDSLMKLYEGGQSVRDLLGRLNQTVVGGPTAGDMGEGTKLSDLEKVMKKLGASLFVLDQQAKDLGQDGLTVAEGKLNAFSSAYKSLLELMFEGDDVSQELAYVTQQMKAFQGVVSDETSLQATGDAFLALNKRLEDIRETFDTGLIDAFELQNQQMSAYQSAMMALIPILGTEHQLVLDLAKAYGFLAEQKQKNNTTTVTQTEEGRNAAMVAQQTAYIIAQLSQNMTQAASSSQSFGSTMVSAMKEAANAVLSLVFTQMIQNALNPEHPANKISLGGVGLVKAAVGYGVLKGLINSIPAFAQGGIVSGAQLAMVGDNRSGKEAIIPLEKLPTLMERMGGTSGGRVYGTLNGYDIALSGSRSGKRFQRISG